MKIIQNTTQFQIPEETSVAIGKFDGIHRGHKLLLEEVLAAKKNGLKAAVFTFDPPPSVLFGGTENKELTTLIEKRAYFDRMGIDYLVEYPLNAQSASITPEEYVTEFLLHKMHAKLIVAGSDVSFGNKGAGDAKLLCEIAAQNDCSVVIKEKLCHEGKEISSTFVRNEVERGNMELVETLLGEPFFVSGEITHGNQIGRTWGFPTINLRPENNKILPPNGVYFSEIYIEKKKYFGVTNVGYKPTVGGEHAPGVETFLYDFTEDVYGKEAVVTLKHFVRPEYKFADFAELKAVIDQNVAEGRIYFNL